MWARGGCPNAVTCSPSPAPLYQVRFARVTPDPLICILPCPPEGSELCQLAGNRQMHSQSSLHLHCPNFFPSFFLLKTVFKNESLSSALSSLVNFVPCLICSGDLLSLPAAAFLPPAILGSLLRPP